MSLAPTHLGDTHNFGRRVTRREGRIHKPRALFWEWLVLSAESPVRRLLAEAALRDGLGPEAFAFLPDLAFFPPRAVREGAVEEVALAPLPDLAGEERRELARVVGRAIALFSWLGVADLHWENLVIGRGRRGETIFAPLDVEMILADLALPTETKLLPEADPEVAEICRHAAGVRRALPWLGKPIDPGDLVAMSAAYLRALAFLDRHARAVADALATLPELREAPIRVCLRGTDQYVRARSEPVWPPLLDAEAEQMARGDIPYFFRLYGRPGIHWFADATLAEIATLPREGDVPQLDPLLQVSRGLRAPSRRKLREEGLFTLLGAFDHRSFAGTHGDGDLEVTFRGRTLVVKLPGGEELSVKRDMRAFVGSAYLPCRCGEVRSVFVPAVTACEAAGP
jgi:hypothetical protein